MRVCTITCNCVNPFLISRWVVVVFSENPLWQTKMHSNRISIYRNCKGMLMLENTALLPIPHYRTWCIFSACIKPLSAASPLAASEAGLRPSARLGSFPNEAPWRTLQEHDRPSGNQLPGPQIAPQGLPAWLLPVTAIPAAPHPPKPAGGTGMGGNLHLFFSLLLLSLFPLPPPLCFLSSFLYRGCGNRPPLLSPLFFLTTSSLLSGRSGCPGGVYSSAAASVNGLSLPPTHDHWLLQNPSQGSLFQEKNRVIKWHSSDCTCNIRLTVAAPYGVVCVCVFVYVSGCVCVCVCVCHHICV